MVIWQQFYIITATKNCMTEDILHGIRQTHQCQNIDYTPEMYNEALVLIKDLCGKNLSHCNAWLGLLVIK